MPVIWIKFPEFDDFESLPLGRPRHCPYCGSHILQRWGRATKLVQDVENEEMVFYRYKCAICEHTFRGYPEGTDRASRSQRVRIMAGLAWFLGMSCRDVVELFGQFELEISHTSVWREGQNLVDKAKEKYSSGKVRRFTIDRVYLHKISTRQGIIVALNLGIGKTAVLGTLNDSSPQRVKKWIESLIENVQVDIFVRDTDSLDPHIIELEPSLDLVSR